MTKITKRKGETVSETPRPAGKVKAPSRETRALPKRGRCKVYLVTCAQSNTLVHEGVWQNLTALAEHDGAEVLVASITYDTLSRAAKAAKRKTAKETGDGEEWWDERVVPYLCDRSVQIAPGLVWAGELNILPTAVNPISGLESYTGRDSTIIPHVKCAMASIASPKRAGTKFIYTTGTVTQRNYIEKKAGQKASFHHSYGGLIVEVLHDGTWFVRQLNADSEGTIYDLDRKSENGRVTGQHRIEALAWGDIHTRQLEPAMANLGWGAGGMLDTLRPRRQFLHDVLDFRSANHHDRDDPWKSFDKHVGDASNVADEVQQAAEFLRLAARPWCDTVVVRSNHDEAMVRWLKEADHKQDPENALFHLEANCAAYRAYKARDEGFDAIEWAFRRAGAPKAVKFLRRDEPSIVCPDAAGGIECGMHGDKGANGRRGALRDFARTGQKAVVGHSHSAGIMEGAYQVGVMAALDMGYNQGQSSWSHTNCVIYPNGKRALLTCWNGRWRG